MTETLTHLIGGKHSGAAKLDSLNPSNTEDIVARYPDGGAEEVNDAVAAARAAFPGWSSGSPEVRADLLDKIGTMILERRETSGPAFGARRRQNPAGSDRRDRARRPHLQIFRRRGAAPSRPQYGIHAPRRRSGDLSRSGGRLWPDHAVEFPHRHSGLEDRPGAGVRQYRGAEIRQPDARRCGGAGRDHRRSGRAGRCFQYGAGRAQSGRRAGQAS